MSRMFRFVLTSLVVALAGLGVAPVLAETEESRDPAVDRLAASVDRLAAFLEREVALRAEDRLNRRVEVAADILALRYRKVERLENEIRQVSREEEELPGIVAMMKTEIDRLEDAEREAGDQATGAYQGEIDAMKARIRVEEDRVARMRERKLILENDLTAEQRRLAHVEAVLDEWLDNLE